MTLRYVASVLLGALALAEATGAQAEVLHLQVAASANLYFENWGHPYVDTSQGEQTQWNALGDGTSAVAVARIFHRSEALSISAAGCVIDAATMCTDADGYASLWRGLPTYALIGMWSQSAQHVIPIFGSLPFFIGTKASFNTPNFSGPLYLFLAENDGGFSDNAYAYDVTLVVDSVPEPAPTALLLPALAYWLYRRKVMPV